LHIFGTSHLSRRKFEIDHRLPHQYQAKLRATHEADRGGQGGDEEGEAERGYGDRYRYSQSATK
jgi:hypothetical protein